MKKIWKSALMCLLAFSVMAASGSVYAVDSADESESSSEAESEKSTAKAKETEEKISVSGELVKKHLKKTGSADGYDVYLLEKDFDDKLWEKNGGKPKKKSDYSAEQQKLADDIGELKKLGDLTIIESRSGKASATFKTKNKYDGGLLYVSESGRYLLKAEEETLKPINVMEVVSTIDDACVYRSKDGKTLSLTDKKHSKVLKTFSYKKTDGGRRIFSETDGNSFAWTSADLKQVIGVFRYGAENEYFRMIVDDRFGNFGIEDKKTGYVWWSSPLGASRDSIASPLISDELRSSCVLRYGIPEKRNNNNYLRSATDDCEISVSDIKDGIRAVYSYQSAGFELPVEYTLENDHITARLKVSDIRESNSENKATEITLLGAFGSADTSENGYFVVPDGSGAIIRFNTKKATQRNSYRQRIYGNDITAVPATKGASQKQIYFPVYGIVKDEGAMLAVASGGDTNAYISVKTSGQSGSSRNLCNFAFILRDTDDYYMSGSSNERFTMFESGDIKSDDIEVRYYPIMKKGADYNDIAERYRQYLLEEENVGIKAENGYAPLYTGFYGGTLKKESVLGIPFTMKNSLTAFDEAEKILTKLRDGGVDSMVVTYRNWTDNGIECKTDSDAEPSGKLGGNSGFEGLRKYIADGGDEFYPISDNRDFYSGNGCNSFSDTAVRISGAYARVVSYDRAYGVPDGFRKNMSLLSPEFFSGMFSDTVRSFSESGIEGIGISGLSTSLYGDYGKKNISRGKTAEILKEGLEKLDSALENGVLADNANAYLLPYVSHIMNVPMSSGRFDIFDEDIPFYQLVMHGVIPCSVSAVNGSAEPEKLLLMAALTGTSLNFDFIYEEAAELKDTEFDTLFYANYERWTDTATAEYRLLEPVLKDVSGSFIEKYSVSDDGQTASAVYANGSEIKVNFGENTIIHNGKLIELDKYAEEGGFTF